MKSVALNLVVLLTLCGCGHVAAKREDATVDRLPDAVSGFAAQVRDDNAGQTLNAAIARFGPPTRDIGSGLSIPEWTVAGGELIVHPLIGPTFTFADGHVQWLIPTQNTARENLVGQFEMTTPPDAGNHGNMFWIGDVTISPDMKFKFTDSNSNQGHRGDQTANFFMHHNSGKVTVAWPASINDGSLLEQLGDREIAMLTFTDGNASGCFALTSSVQAHQLTIADKSFVLEKRWKRYWRTTAG